MPTPGEDMLNPITNLLETQEQKQKRLDHEQKMKSMLEQLGERQKSFEEIVKIYLSSF